MDEQVMMYERILNYHESHTELELHQAFATMLKKIDDSDWGTITHGTKLYRTENHPFDYDIVYNPDDAPLQVDKGIPCFNKKSHSLYHPTKCDWYIWDKRAALRIMKDIETWDGKTLLISALKENDYETVDELLELDVDMNRRPFTKNTALNIAVKNGEFEIAKKLIDNGARLNKKYFEDRKLINFILYWNESHASLELIQGLLDIGINIDELNEYGETPLLISLARNKLRIAAFLLERGADWKRNFTIRTFGDAKLEFELLPNDDEERTIDIFGCLLTIEAFELMEKYQTEMNDEQFTRFRGQYLKLLVKG